MGARSNWWYDEQDSEDAPPGYRDEDDQQLAGAEAEKRDGRGAEWGIRHSLVDGTSREERVAHMLFREEATKLCYRTLKEPPDRGWAPHMAAEGINQAPGRDSTPGGA